LKQRPPFGALVTWKDNPLTPAGTVVKSVVYRWSDHELPTAVYTSTETTLDGATGDGNTPPREVRPDPDSPSPGWRHPSGQHEFWDTQICDGLTYTYAVRAVQLDRVEGIEVRRSVLSQSVTSEIPTAFDFEAREFADPKRVLLTQNLGPAERDASLRNARFRLDVIDRRPQVPQRRTLDTTIQQLADRDLGAVAFGIDIGWKVIGIELDARNEPVEIARPIFNADGSVKVDNRPAMDGMGLSSTVAVTRTWETARRGYPVLRLRNKCGMETSIRAAVSRDRAPGAQAPAAGSPR
jgi:hypothetical protein